MFLKLSRNVLLLNFYEKLGIWCGESEASNEGRTIMSLINEV